MKEFLSIGELAKIFDMDVQLLRHYDAKGLLVPQVRNSENSRRFITLTRSIRSPPYDICAALDTRSPRYGIFSITTRCGTILKCSLSRRKNFAANATS